jgi:hypothetical protein
LLSDSPFTGGTNTPSTNSASPSFRTGAASTLPETTPRTPTTPGASSAFGTEGAGAAAPTRAAPATFSVPASYGRSPQQFTVGEGRLARPRFRFTGNVAMGYDDNILQTPTRGQSTQDQKFLVLKKEAVPATLMEVVVPSGDPMVPNSTKTVVVPGEEAEFRTETIRGTPPPQRLGSWVSRTDVGWDVQFASRRTLFTFDLKGGTDYYWERPGKKYEYTGSLALVYLRKLTGRAQFTLSANMNYQAQPDFSQVNAPTSNNRGSYLTTNVKADLSYRLTPRFSTVTSVAYNSLSSMEKAQQSSDYGETTFGTELRYLFSPRLTLLGELRYSSDIHKDNPALDTNTYFVLAGGELTLSRRFTATLRLGESIQTYSESGGKNSAPYAEATLFYRLGRGTTVQWNGRYGYEEAGAPDTQVLVYRSGLSLAQVFNPRFQGSLALNLVRSTSTTTTKTSTSNAASVNSSTASASSSGTDTAGTATGTATTNPVSTTAAETRTKKETITTELVQDTIDATLSFQYILSRHWSLNLSYSYTMLLAPEDTGDYYRQRLFLGAEYQF